MRYCAVCHCAPFYRFAWSLRVEPGLQEPISSQLVKRVPSAWHPKRVLYKNYAEIPPSQIIWWVRVTYAMLSCVITFRITKPWLLPDANGWRKKEVKDLSNLAMQKKRCRKHHKGCMVINRSHPVRSGLYYNVHGHLLRFKLFLRDSTKLVITHFTSSISWPPMSMIPIPMKPVPNWLSHRNLDARGWNHYVLSLRLPYFLGKRIVFNSFSCLS